MKITPKFNKGDVVMYSGTGFLGYDKSNMYAVFDCYEGNYDAYIYYLGFRVLVDIGDISHTKLNGSLNPDGTVNLNWIMNGGKGDK